MSVYDLLTQVGLTSVTDADWNGGREKCFSFVTDNGDKKHRTQITQLSVGSII